MGLFSRKKKKEVKEDIPSLPELPKLPELPRMGEPEKISELKPVNTSQLPSLPIDSLGVKSPENAIKEAVSGEKEGDEVDADEPARRSKTREMHEPLKKSMRTMELPNIEERRSPHSREIEDDILKPTKEKLPESKEFKEESIIKNIEPVFIRIDKFEESLRIFEKVKKDILEIEKMLKDIKTLKEHESRELSHWEREMQRVKDQIDQVDKDIFSKIE